MKIWNFGVNALQLHLFCPHNTKLEIAAVFTAAISLFGGPNRDRTDDLTDANRTLSRGGKFSAHGLRHVGRLYNVRMDYNFLAKTRTANDALKVLHIRFIQLCLE